MSPPPTDHDDIAIIGAGAIGTSVAAACALAGRPVTLIDRPGIDWRHVETTMRRHIRLGRLAGRPAPVDLAPVAQATDIGAAAGARLIVENVTEDLATKEVVYTELRALGCRQAHVLANTSAIPIDRLAQHAPDRGRVVGVHFMNPVPSIDFVEVVRGPATSPETLTAAIELLASLGKRGVVVGDSPGFVVNRILMSMVNQAAQILDEGVASAGDIDQLFKGCLGHAMGPLRTADLIGIDTVVNTLAVLREALDDPRFEPSRALLDLLEKGALGMKAGRGFHQYELKGGAGG